MKKRSLMIALSTICAATITGCSFSVGTNSNNAAPAKPANTTASNTSNTTTAKTASKA